MALKYNSVGMLQAAEDLKTAASNLDTILNQDLVASVGKAKNAYQSETAEELYLTFDKIKEKFPSFLEAVNNCSRYLSETVAPAYQKLENEAVSKVQ